MIPRTAAKTLRSLVKAFPVVLVTGPRQSGKTTLVRDLYPDRSYVLLEDPEERDFAVRDPKGFLRRLKGDAILDEAQNVPALLSHLLGIVDDPDDERHFILTGSQNLLLMQQASQSLAGRIGLLELLPLSVQELQSAKLLGDRPVEEVLLSGFFPRLHAGRATPQQFYTAYERTYVERDVRTIGGVGDLAAFHRFVRLCAGRAGQLLNLSNVANDTGVSQPTARRWLSVLEASYIVRLLPPHHRNFRKRIVKSPKLYFLDTGLLCFLLRLRTAEDVASHAQWGYLFENFVILEAIKYFMHRGEEPPLSFWRDRTGHEVDLLMEDAGALRPIEIKGSYSIPSDAFQSLAYFATVAGSTRGEKALIYCGERSEKREGVRVVPWREMEKVFSRLI